jgi:hypothetical protein
LGEIATGAAVIKYFLEVGAAAFVAELTISFILMITVPFATNRKGLAPYTAYFIGALIHRDSYKFGWLQVLSGLMPWRRALRSSLLHQTVPSAI